MASSVTVSRWPSKSVSGLVSPSWCDQFWHSSFGYHYSIYSSRDLIHWPVPFSDRSGCKQGMASRELKLRIRSRGLWSPGHQTESGSPCARSWPSRTSTWSWCLGRNKGWKRLGNKCSPISTAEPRAFRSSWKSTTSPNSPTSLSTRKDSRPSSKVRMSLS